MATFSTFARDLKLATAGLEPQAIAAQLAKFARAELAGAIQRGEASPIYARFVNGRPGAAEESVVPPGPILYVFSQWGPVLEYALKYLEGRSPKKEGRYQLAHIVMVDGRVVADPSTIPAEATVTIVNTVPYARKIEVGHMKMSVPRGIYEDAEVRIGRQFADVEVRMTMMQLPNGYVLKGRFRRGFREFARRGLQKDTKAGSRMTYPALTLRLSGLH